MILQVYNNNLIIKLNPYNYIFRAATHKIRALPNLGSWVALE